MEHNKGHEATQAAEEAAKNIQNIQFFLNVVELPIKELLNKWILSSNKKLPNKGVAVLNLSQLPEQRSYMCFDIEGEKIKMGIKVSDTPPDIDWIVANKYMPVREELGKLLCNTMSFFDELRSSNPILLQVMFKQEINTTIGLYHKGAKYGWFLSPDLIRE